MLVVSSRWGRLVCFALKGLLQVCCWQRSSGLSDWCWLNVGCFWCADWRYGWRRGQWALPGWKTREARSVTDTHTHTNTMTSFHQQRGAQPQWGGGPTLPSSMHFVLAAVQLSDLHHCKRLTFFPPIFFRSFSLTYQTAVSQTFTQGEFLQHSSS